MPSSLVTTLAALAATAALAASADVSRQVTTMFMPDMDMAREKLTLSPMTVETGGGGGDVTKYMLTCGSYRYGEKYACGGVGATDMTYTLGPSTARLVQSGTAGSRQFECAIDPSASTAECTVTHASVQKYIVNNQDPYATDYEDPYTMDDAAYNRYYATRSYSYSVSTSSGSRTVTLTGTRFENAIHTAVFAQDENNPVVTASGDSGSDAAKETGASASASQGTTSSSGADGVEETKRPDSGAGGVSVSMGAVVLGALVAML